MLVQLHNWMTEGLYKKAFSYWWMWLIAYFYFLSLITSVTVLYLAWVLLRFTSLHFWFKGSTKCKRRDFSSSNVLIPLAVVLASAVGKLPCVVRASDPWLRHLQRERLPTALRERPSAKRVQLSDDTYARCVRIGTHALHNLLLMCMSPM